MTYSAGTPIIGNGSVSAEAIDAWLESRAASGAQYVGLPQVPIPADMGRIIIEECERYPQAVVNHDLVAAQIAHESAACQSRIARDKRNYCGYGAENDAPYVKAYTFATPREGVRVQVAHLLGYVVGDGPWNADSPRYSIVKRNGWAGSVRVLRDLEQKWAYTSPATYVQTPQDQRYGAKVAAAANALTAFAATVEEPTTMPKIALSAGHHNTSGGDAHETVQTGRLTPVIASTLRARGFDVRVITPDDGRGMYPGGLYDAAYEVVRWSNEGWRADVFLEVHTEGNGAGDAVRGAFAIYPDWEGDLDTDVRDNLGPDIVRRLQEKTGLPKRGSGVMSEKQTGVGIDGFRLGVFRATEPVKAQTTRAIVEYGSHTSPADLALWAKPDFLQNAADATADALAVYTGAQPVPEPAPSPAAKLILPGQGSESPDIYPPNVGLQLGFNGVYLAMGAAKYANDPALGILTLTGWAKEDEWEGVDGCVYQRFHRVTLQYDPRNAQPWDIVQMHPDTDLPEQKV